MGFIVTKCTPGGGGDGDSGKRGQFQMPVTDTSRQPTTFLERDDWMRAVLASDLPPVAVRVAVAIGLHLHVKSGRCDPGIPDIIAATGNIPERSIYRQIALLKKAGWLSIRRIRRAGRHNEYVLTKPAKAMAGNEPERPAKAVAGNEPSQPATGDRVYLPKQASVPATTVAGQDKRQAKKIQAADAHTSAAGERESEHTLADPGAPAPGGGARKEEFDRLWALWSSHRNFPDSDEDEARGWEAYVAIVPHEADPGEIYSRAEAHIAGVKANGLKVGDLYKWLSRNNWRKEPAPPPSRKPKRGGKVSTAQRMFEQE
jgi:hypothetical protein